MRVFLVFSALCLLACSGSTPLARFTVVKQEVDESCTKLTDFCVRVSCTVKNEGAIPGQAVVDLQILGPEGNVLFTETERTELGGGDTTTLSHDFTQAKITQKGRSPRCVVR